MSVSGTCRGRRFVSGEPFPEEIGQHKTTQALALARRVWVKSQKVWLWGLGTQQHLLADSS